MLTNYYTYINESTDSVGRKVKIREDASGIKRSHDHGQGKLEEKLLLESKKDIGRRVKMKHDSYHSYQAYGKNGQDNGMGKIVDFTDYSEYFIRWDNGNWNVYRMSDFDFLDEMEPEKPIRTRWYNKGKLEEKLLLESAEDIGRRVKMRPGSYYHKQAYGRNGEYDGMGKIVDFNEYLEYIIQWDHGHENTYGRSDFDFLDEIEPEKPTRTRWYNKGKLEENYDYQEYRPGDIVIVNGVVDDREFDNIISRILQIDDESILDIELDEIGAREYKGIAYYIEPLIDDITYSGNQTWWVSPFNIELYKPLNIEPEKPSRTRWYNKGKLEENLLLESKEDIGRRVQLKYGSRYHKQAYGVRNEFDGIGQITDYDDESKFEHRYKIQWNNGQKNSYDISDFDFLDDVKPFRTRWYNKGKLEEGLNSDEIQVGQRVKNLRFGDGVIIDIVKHISSGYVGVEFDKSNNVLHNCGGQGKNHYCYWIPIHELKFLEEDKPSRIRWYNKGRLQNENKKLIYKKNKTF